MTIPEYTCPNCGHEDPKVAADIKAAAVMAIEMTRQQIADPAAATKAGKRIEQLATSSSQPARGETPAKAQSRRDRRKQR